MDATQIVTLAVAVLAAGTGVMAMRSDRTKGMAEAANLLVDPLRERLREEQSEVAHLERRVCALEAEIEGWAKECQRLRGILDRYGINDLE